MKALLSGGGWFNLASEGLPLVRQALAMTGQAAPRLLVIPTPTSSPATEVAALKEIFGDTLTMFTNDDGGWPNFWDARTRINGADTILTTGGNLAELMELLRNDQNGYGALLLDASDDPNKSFVGGSAGLGLWFRAVHTRDRIGGALDEEYHLEPGLSRFGALVSAHANEYHAITGVPRAWDLRIDMGSQPVGTVGIAVDTRAALAVIGNNVSVTSDDRYARVLRYEKTEDGVVVSIHKRNEQPIPLNDFFGTA